MSYTQRIIGSVAVLLVAGAALCDALQVPRSIPGSYIECILTAKDWRHPDQAGAKLVKLIDERLKSTDEAAISEFLKEPYNRLLLADADMLTMEKRGEPARIHLDEERRTNLERLKKEHTDYLQRVSAGTQPPAKLAHLDDLRCRHIRALERELAEDHSISQSADFAELVGSNLDWASQMSSSGEYSPAGEALSILKKIAAANPNMPYKPTERDIATATALEFACQGLLQDDAVNRADVLTKAWRKGKLNKSFDRLPPVANPRGVRLEKQRSFQWPFSRSSRVSK